MIDILKIEWKHNDDFRFDVYFCKSMNKTGGMQDCFVDTVSWNY